MISALLKCHTGQCHDVIFALHYCRLDTRCQQKISFMLGFLYASEVTLDLWLWNNFYDPLFWWKAKKRQILGRYWIGLTEVDKCKQHNRTSASEFQWEISWYVQL